MIRASFALFALSVACSSATVDDSPSAAAGSRAEGGTKSDGASGAGGGGGASGTGGGTSGGGGGSGGGGTSGADGGGDAGGADGGGGGDGGGAEVSLLIFSRTVEYRHSSIEAGVQALTELAAERGWRTAATEDPGEFTDEGLSRHQAVIFLSTTGDVLNDEQQAAFERFIRQGRGFVGIHAATDTEYDWPWYGELVGAYFRTHPAVQAAELIVEAPNFAATRDLPSPWRRTDEWYAFQSNPRAHVHVLLSLDESSYEPGDSSMQGDHPVAWYHEHDGGRAFYTALGHTRESYSDPLFLAHVAGGIAWALDR